MGAMSLSTPDVMQIHQGHEHGFSAVSNRWLAQRTDAADQGGLPQVKTGSVYTTEPSLK
jgi:hypothetical protein